ncbi:hypothetical protein U9M48_015558, partial [Paspalum notatum var. saurae]
AISKRARNQCTVFQALTNRRWVKDIRGALTVQVLVEYVKVWEMVDDPGVPDHFRWRFTQSGQYSCKSAYQSFFLGTVKFGSWKRIWKSWALLRCKFFIWLAIKNRCWTADRLAKRGLLHPNAVFKLVVRAVSRAPKELKKGLNSLIILVAWEVWKHRIACVFEEIRPCVSVICQEIEKEGSLWCLAGNSALSSLRARMGRLGL